MIYFVTLLFDTFVYTFGVDARVRSQHCGHWCPGAKAKCLSNIYCIAPSVHKYTVFAAIIANCSCDPSAEVLVKASINVCSVEPFSWRLLMGMTHVVAMRWPKAPILWFSGTLLMFWIWSAKVIGALSNWVHKSFQPWWGVCWMVDLNGCPSALTLEWRHYQGDGVSNHQPHDCLLNRLFRRRSKKTSKLRVTGLCPGNSPVTGEFPT